jgi:glycosyltransferase involved in cell wall biosynthesis
MIAGAPASYRAEIAPVADGEPRPLWSVMVPTFNCARYLRETLLRLLAQAPGPDEMQIEVVDDHSTADDPRAVVDEMGGGRVAFHCQPQNVGHVRNFESCLTRARGHLVHLLHGDDYVLDGFYETLGRAFLDHPEIGAAFCRQVYVDEDGRRTDVSPLERDRSGVLGDWLERIAAEQRILTPSIVVRRAVYERVGGFDRRLVCAEDWEMWVRIAAHYPVWYETEPLAAYRVHPASNTGRHVRSGDDVRYTRLAIELFEPYLPPERARGLTREARRTYAFSALSTAEALAGAGDLRGASAQMREALRCRCSPAVIRRAVGVVARAVV